MPPNPATPEPRELKLSLRAFSAATSPRTVSSSTLPAAVGEEHRHAHRSAVAPGAEEIRASLRFRRHGRLHRRSTERCCACDTCLRRLHAHHFSAWSVFQSHSVRPDGSGRPEEPPRSSIRPVTTTHIRSRSPGCGGLTAARSDGSAPEARREDEARGECNAVQAILPWSTRPRRRGSGEHVGRPAAGGLWSRAGAPEAGPPTPGAEPRSIRSRPGGRRRPPLPCAGVSCATIPANAISRLARP